MPRRWLILITLVACALRVWGLTFGLPLLQARPDEDAVIDHAAAMLTGGPNPHFFNYPTLYLYLMAAVIRGYIAWGRMTASIAGDPMQAIAAVDHAARLHLLDRAVVALLGTATIPVMYWASRRLFSPAVGLLTAGFLAVAFLHVRDSHFGVTDVPATFMIVLAFSVVVTRHLDWRHRWTAMAAAVLCGLAASTKYNAAIVVAPLMVAAAAQEWRESRKIATVAALMAWIAAGAAAGFLIGTPFAALDYPAFRAGLDFERAHLAEGHGIAAGLGWWRHLNISLWYGVGWPMLFSALAGIIVLVTVYPAQAPMVLSFPLLYYAAIGSGQTVFARYMVPVVPFICLLAALPVSRVAEMLRWRGAGGAAAFTVTAVLTAAIVAPNIARSVAFDRLVSVTDNRLVAARWLETVFPSGATVYQTGLPYPQLQLAAPFSTWSYDPAVDLLTASAAQLPRLVVVPSSPLTVYTGISDLASRVLRARYRSVGSFPVEVPGRSERLVYDEQDAFFVPLSGFSRVRRPGPAIEVFERKEP